MPDDLHPTMDPSVVTEQTFPSDLRWVRRVIQKTTDALATFEVSAEDIGSVEIVLAEALNNVVEHAYPGEPGAGEIRLVVKKRSSGLLVEVSDRGDPMPNGRAPLGNHPMTEFGSDPMPEGGYGWFLIREIVRDLIYDRRDGQNYLIFRIALG